MFDIVNFLEDEKIEYWLDGKNVVDGWVNVNCVFCEDESNHLGFDLKRPLTPKCWRCGKHTLYEYLSEGFEVDSWNKFNEVINKYQIDGTEDEIITYSEMKPPTLKIQLPPSQPFDLNTRNYLWKRGFNVEQLKADWFIFYGGYVGEYKFRIIIPIYSNRTLVSFQGRDTTGNSEEKYKTCSGTYINDYLYGLDFIYNDRIIITEGVTDVWRVGRGYGVCTFGINYSIKQLSLIVKKKIKKVIIFFDEGESAQEQALELQSELQMFDIDCLNFIGRKGLDPAEHSQEDIELLKKKLDSM